MGVTIGGRKNYGTAEMRLECGGALGVRPSRVAFTKRAICGPVVDNIFICDVATSVWRRHISIHASRYRFSKTNPHHPPIVFASSFPFAKVPRRHFRQLVRPRRIRSPINSGQQQKGLWRGRFAFPRLGAGVFFSGSDSTKRAFSVCVERKKTPLGKRLCRGLF